MSNGLLPWRWLDDPASVYLTRDRLVRVAGAGGRSWLNSLLTADIRSPAPNVARYTLLLNPRGGIVSDAWVVEYESQGSEGLALVLPETHAYLVYRLLDKHLVNEDLSLALDDEIRVVALLGEGRSELVNGTPGAWAAYSSTRLGFGSLDLWVAASEVESFFRRLSASARRLGGGSIDGAAWTSARIALGIPLVGVDFDETVSPLEAGLDGRAVSFSKGCYLGQEIVARQHRGGGLAQRLVQFEVDGVDSVPAGSRLFDSAGAEVGRVTSSARRTAERGNMLALGYLKASLAQPGACVTVGSRTIRVRCLVGRHDSAGARQTG